MPRKPWMWYYKRELGNRKKAYELTSFVLAPQVKHLKDQAWEKYLSEQKTVQIIAPQRIGAPLKIQSITEDDLPIILGKIELYNFGNDYDEGIIGHLRTDIKTYKNGDKASILEPFQPILIYEGVVNKKEVLKGTEIPPIIQEENQNTDKQSFFWIMSIIIFLILGYGLYTLIKNLSF